MGKYIDGDLNIVNDQDNHDEIKNFFYESIKCVHLLLRINRVATFFKSLLTNNAQRTF
jgi:hypothetical protein